MSRAAFTAWMAAALVAGPIAGHAELFRCVGPDGKTVYTDQKSTCPGAEPSQPSGVVHRATASDAPAPGPASASPLAAPGKATRKNAADASKQWRQKKVEAEQQVERIHARHEWIKEYVSYCNRGAYVTTRDDAGIQQVVNCSELKREFHDLEKQEADARAYLDTGLAQECRKAGCLPGWLR